MMRLLRDNPSAHPVLLAIALEVAFQQEARLCRWDGPHTFHRRWRWLLGFRWYLMAWKIDENPHIPEG